MLSIVSRFMQSQARGMFAILFGGLVFGFASACHSQTNVRVWSDPTGTYSTEAELILATPQAVTLKKVNGVTIVVPISRLSAFDKKIVNRKLQRELAVSVHPQPPVVVSGSENRPSSQSQSSPEMALNAASEIPSKVLAIQANATLKQPPVSLNVPSQSPSIPAAEAFRPVASQNAIGNETLLHSATQPANKANEFFNENGFFQPNKLEVNSFSALNSRPARLDRTRGSARSPGSSTTPSKMDSVLQVRLRKAMVNFPEEDADAIIESARKATHSLQSSTRKLALEFLSQHDGKQSLDLIVDGLNDQNFDVRWAAFTSLKKNLDPRAIRPLSRMLLTTDAQQAASVLRFFGTQAESSVTSLLDDGTPENLVVICSLLSKIGSAQSLPKLQDLASNSSVNKVRLQAQHSIDSIENRIAGDAFKNEKLR